MLWLKCVSAFVIVKPETVIRWALRPALAGALRLRSRKALGRPETSYEFGNYPVHGSREGFLGNVAWLSVRALRHSAPARRLGNR